MSKREERVCVDGELGVCVDGGWVLGGEGLAKTTNFKASSKLPLRPIRVKKRSENHLQSYQVQANNNAYLKLQTSVEYIGAGNGWCKMD